MTTVEIPAAPAPVYWPLVCAATPCPDGTDPEVRRYALMAQAHHLAYSEAIVRRADTAGRRAVDEHFYPMTAAFTAAASLKGWASEQITDAIEDGGSLLEFLWEWLNECGVSEGVMDRLVTQRPGTEVTTRG